MAGDALLGPFEERPQIGDEQAMGAGIADLDRLQRVVQLRMG